MITLLEAIDQRHSVRHYKDIPLSEECRKLLQDKIQEINSQSGLHFQLVCDEKKAFSGLPAYGKFSGVNAYIVAAGKKAPDLDEQIGYYGEALVLFAQSIGLNSCWAGVSYTKIKDTYILEKDEKIACYIAIGYGETPGIQHKSKAFGIREVWINGHRVLSNGELDTQALKSSGHALRRTKAES